MKASLSYSAINTDQNPPILIITTGQVRVQANLDMLKHAKVTAETFLFAVTQAIENMEKSTSIIDGDQEKKGE